MIYYLSTNYCKYYTRRDERERVSLIITMQFIFKQRVSKGEGIQRGGDDGGTRKRVKVQQSGI
jgi:hypothetical protein